MAAGAAAGGGDVGADYRRFSRGCYAERAELAGVFQRQAAGEAEQEAERAPQWVRELRKSHRELQRKVKEYEERERAPVKLFIW